MHRVERTRIHSPLPVREGGDLVHPGPRRPVSGWHRPVSTARSSFGRWTADTRSALVHRRDSQHRERHHGSRRPLHRLPWPAMPTWWICGADAPPGRTDETPSTGHSSAVRIVVGDGPVQRRGFVGQIGRFYDDGGWTLYRVGLSRPFVGPVGLTYHGDYMTRVGRRRRSLRRSGHSMSRRSAPGAQGPYAVAGVGGGLASPHSRSFSSFWAIVVRRRRVRSAPRAVPHVRRRSCGGARSRSIIAAVSSWPPGFGLRFGGGRHRDRDADPARRLRRPYPAGERHWPAPSPPVGEGPPAPASSPSPEFLSSLGGVMAPRRWRIRSSKRRRR